MNPTATHVATAIVAACRGAGFDPAKIAPQVAQGVSGRGRGSGGPVRVVRAYAALALRAVFEDVPQVSIARMVGSTRTESYFPQIDLVMRAGTTWWRDDVFMAVVSAIERVPPHRAPIILLKQDAIRRVRRALGAIIHLEQFADRPPHRPRAEQITDDR